jgi:hypothetical protein
MMANKVETLRAKAGAALLDLLRPGWVVDINQSMLRLDNCHACVLGQLFGTYNTGAERIFAMRLDSECPASDETVSDRRNRADEIACEAGFFAPDDPTVDQTKYYNNLTSAWKREIAKRLTKNIPA